MTFTRSPQGTLYGRAVADDTLGELVVRRLSRGRLVVKGESPYIRCMLGVMCDTRVLFGAGPTAPLPNRTFDVKMRCEYRSSVMNVVHSILLRVYVVKAGGEV